MFTTYDEVLRPVRFAADVDIGSIAEQTSHGDKCSRAGRSMVTLILGGKDTSNVSSAANAAAAGR